MKLSIRKNATSRTLFMASLGLLTAISLELMVPAQLPNRAASEIDLPALPKITSPPTYIPASFDLFSEILERPLLYHDRKLPPAAVPVVEIPREPLQLNLEGVALGGGARIALLRDQRDNQLIQIAEGMGHNGWILHTIESDKAMFSRGKEFAELYLEIQPNRRHR